jgi:hypothetical protein
VIKTVEVCITDIDIIQQAMDYTGEMYILRCLRAKGIPVKGIFAFRGVERGTLSVIDGKSFNGKKFIWREEAPEPA